MNITRAQFELSSKCNFKCITCRHGYSDFGEDMPDCICDILCAEVLPMLKTLELQGTGESLLNPHLSKVINKASTCGCNITLITNGSLLSEPLLKHIIQAGVQLVVSLDGANEEIYSRHRPVGSFDQIVNNLTKISDLRSNYHETTFSFVVNMVLTQLNCGNIPQMISLLSKLGADYLFVSEVRECMPDKDVWGKLNLLSVSSSLEFTDMLERCAILARENKLGFSFNPNQKTPAIKKRVCEAPWRHLFVTANGDVSICCELSNSFGNLNKQSLSEILSCKELNEFRNNMLIGEYDKHCLNCCLPWGLPY
ncbi:putative GTP 3',8-cyclase [Pillotina sp. SPG140]